MTDDFPASVDVDYADGEGEDPADYPSLQHKIEKAIEVTRQGLAQYDTPAVMWTGGKDSTLTLYFINQVAEEYGYEKPTAVFIDHFQHFDSITDFVEHWADEWGIDLVYADTYVGNHLLKTVALNNALEAHDIDGVISGVRWDEQEARADETFFSPRHDPDLFPPHDRIQPILQFAEADVWEAFWNYVVPDTVEAFPDEGYVPQADDDLPEGVSQEDIPISPKYFAGFRSLGSEVSTDKTTEEPAWLQDLEGTTERAGRAQDKEDLMERLRDLGYM